MHHDWKPRIQTAWSSTTWIGLDQYGVPLLWRRKQSPFDFRCWHDTLSSKVESRSPQSVLTVQIPFPIYSLLRGLALTWLIFYLSLVSSLVVLIPRSRYDSRIPLFRVLFIPTGRKSKRARKKENKRGEREGEKGRTGEENGEGQSISSLRHFNVALLQPVHFKRSL